MKNLIIIFICCISVIVLAFSIQVPSGKYQNDLADENLKGPVRSCFTYSYDSPKKGNIIDSNNYWCKINCTYNTHGDDLFDMILLKGGDGKNDSIETFTGYDKMDRILFRKDKSGKIISKNSYSFNKQHNLIEIRSAGSVFKTIYNKAGLPDTIYDITNNNTIRLKNTYQYNEINDQVEEVDYNDAGYINCKIIRIYNTRHQKIEEITYQNATENGFPSYKSKSNFTYDHWGNIIMELDSNDMRVGGYSYFVNKPDSAAYRRMKCKYSNFDKYQNWLRKDFLYGDTIKATNIRQIKYYSK